MSKNVTLLKKIVAKNLVAGRIKDIAKAIENDLEKTQLYKLVGQATGYETGEGNFGPWIAFKGNFEAYDKDLNVYKSNKAFVQEPLQSMIKEVLDGDAEMCEFGLTVAVRRRDDLEVGYEYEISPMIEVAESDSLTHLRTLALEDNSPADELKKPPKKTAAKK